MKIIRSGEIDDKNRGNYMVKELGALLLHDYVNDGILFETRLPKGNDFKEQWHEQSTEMIYFLDRGLAIVNGNRYELQKGDILILEPKERHKIIAEYGDVTMFATRFPNLPHDKYT
mgnify:CR=1 FL=1